MAIPYLTAPAPVGITEANSVFEALDDALGVLFNNQSPLLYLTQAEWKAAGLAGLFVVFGTKASRRLFPSVDSHDQTSIDDDVAAAMILDQDDTLKQVELDMAGNALSKSLVIQKRTVTPPSGPDEDYFVKVAFATGLYHHERRHDLAAVDVVFEGHAARTFTWLAAWDKCRCLRLHNLDTLSTPLVVTMENTGETFSLDPWDCITIRLSDDGTTWEQQGFVLWRMRTEDLTRLGLSMPWNDRRRALSGETADSVWYADGANNVASWALVVHLLDHFAVAGTPGETSDVGDGVADALDPKTGLSFDLSDLTHNAGRLPPFPSPTDSSSLLYQLAWHGGKLITVEKPTVGSEVVRGGSPTIAGLLAGHAATNLVLEVDGGGATAHLKVLDETGLDYVDVIPVGSNLGASGHPFTVPADGVGYSLPSALPLTWDGINRLSGAVESETVYGIATTVTTDYMRLSIENSVATYADPLNWSAFGGQIGDVQNWSFHDSTKNNDHGTFYTNSVKWDGRRLSVNVQLRLAPADGACPSDAAALAITENHTVLPADAHLDWYQNAPVQTWPASGGAWHTPKYVRRSMSPDTTAVPMAHPNSEQAYGTTDGADYVMRDSRLFTRSRGIKRQLPINDVSGAGITPTNVELTGCYFLAEDSTQFIVENVNTAGWWASNRTSALAGSALSGETRPVVAPVLCARHYNVIAQRLNALLSVVPFSFLDAQWYGRPFRPDYSAGGIFGGHVYPAGFMCYAVGDAATRAADLGISIRSTATELAAYSAFSAIDVDLFDTSGLKGRAFDVAGGTPFDAWNMDLPYWFNPDASLNRNESVEVCDVDPETISGEPGWTQGELAFQTASNLGPGTDVDWYGWYRANDAAYEFPDFDYIRVDDAQTAAAYVSIPFRLIRLCSGWKLQKFDPDRQGLGVRQLLSTYYANTYPGTGAYWPQSWTRTEVRLVPEDTDAPLVMFAGTGERWAGSGLVRVSDWKAYPGTQGSDDAGIQSANADPMHGFDRSGSGYEVEFPYGFHPIVGTIAPTWQNSGPFSGEAKHLTVEVYDTTPAPPAGWTDSTHRIGSYPVPITQWGASDLESNPAPSCAPAWIATTDLPGTFSAEDLWGVQGTGAWDGNGAFAVQLFSGGKIAP